MSRSPHTKGRKRSVEQRLVAAKAHAGGVLLSAAEVAWLLLVHPTIREMAMIDDERERGK